MKYFLSFLLLFSFASTAWGALSAPTSLHAAAVSTSAIKLTWTDNSYKESGFLIERSLSSSSGFVGVGSVGMGMSYYTNSSLSSGTKYYYRLRAYKKSSTSTSYSSYSSIASAVTLSPYTYSWSVGSWSACSAVSCGTNGVQTRSVICKRNDGVSVADSNCTATKPAVSQPCSAKPCPTPTPVPTPTPTPPPAGVPTGAINVKDKGAKGDGITDDLVAFQNSVSAVPLNGTMYVPAGNYMFNVDSTAKYIKLKSNMHLMMDPNAVLTVKGNNLERYYLISISGVTNVEVSGGRLVGDRDHHVGTTGEWGYGIRMAAAASGINIHDVYIEKFWGDGLCIGGYAKDIEIRRVVATQNRRQGLSITRSENVLVIDSEFSYTNGTAPQYGIDIEPDPDPNGFYAKNIRIENCKIHHNVGGGIQAYHQTYGIVITKNDISYNNYGIYTSQSFNSEISYNTIAHNKNRGATFNSGTDSYKTFENVFRNNSTSTYGISNDTNSLVTITGQLSGSSGTSPHIVVNSTATNISILKNYYAK